MKRHEVAEPGRSRQIEDLLTRLTDRELEQIQARVTLLRGQMQDPVILSDEEERFYLVVCEAVRRRGVIMPADEPKRMILLRGGKLVLDLTKAVEVCSEIAREVAPSDVLRRVEIYGLLAKLALEACDQALWHRNHKARLANFAARLLQGDVVSVTADMQRAVEHWAPPAGHGLKQVFAQLMNAGQLLDDAFPGYGVTALRLRYPGQERA